MFDDTLAVIDAVRWRGARTAVVSASENCVDILRRAGLLERFDLTVTGLDAARLGLAASPRPTPSSGRRAPRRRPGDAVVFEDALAGVQAGRAGGFGLVVGVDRGDAGEALLRNGADIACADLRRLLPDG